MKPPEVNAHRLVADTACEMANAVFEEAMSRDNELFRSLKRAHPGKSTEFLRRYFTKCLAPHLVGDARATLAKMLNTTQDETLKETIYEALLKDASLTMGRKESAVRRLN